MSLIIDQASIARSLTPEEFTAWAAGRVIFISSEMRDLADVRRVLADGLRAAGFQVVMFEDLGGRDEDAQTSYLTGVAKSHIYLGIIGDRYGTILPSGDSPTYEEFREARERGLRMSVWIHADGAQRDGRSRDFVQEVQVFHTTGTFRDGDDLLRSVLSRLREVAADDEQPWVKLGDAVFRCSRFQDNGSSIKIQATVRDPEVARYLRDLNDTGSGRGAQVQVVSHDNAGIATITGVSSARTSRSSEEFEITGDVQWGPSEGLMEAGVGGLSPDEQVKAGLEAALFGEPLPDALAGFGAGMFGIDTEDPLAPLAGLPLDHPTYEAIAQLLLTERLIGKHGVSAVLAADVGPLTNGSRSIHLVWRARQRYTNQAPWEFEINGRHRT